VTTARPVAVRLTERIVVGDPPAVEANMTDVVDLNFLARQMDRLLTETNEGYATVSLRAKREPRDSIQAG
jgi:hypothetical protein